MDFYKEIVITKKIPIPFSEARNNIVWVSSNNLTIKLPNLIDNYLNNILDMLLNFNNLYSATKNSNYTTNQWIEIFRLEIELRNRIRKQTSLSSIK